VRTVSKDHYGIWDNDKCPPKWKKRNQKQGKWPSTMEAENRVTNHKPRDVWSHQERLGQEEAALSTPLDAGHLGCEGHTATL
jgi:hypothetical protein